MLWNYLLSLKLQLKYTMYYVSLNNDVFLSRLLERSCQVSVSVEPGDVLMSLTALMCLCCLSSPLNSKQFRMVLCWSWRDSMWVDILIKQLAIKYFHIKDYVKFEYSNHAGIALGLPGAPAWCGWRSLACDP